MRVRVIKTSLFLFLIIAIIFLAVVDLKNHLVTVIANQDKYLHFFTFFLLFLLAAYIFKAPRISKIALSLFIFGLVLEFLQELLSQGTRHFHVLDVAFNVLGIGVAWLSILIYRRLKH